MSAWMADARWWVIAAAALLVVALVVSALRAALMRRRSSRSVLHGGYLVATVVIAAAALVLITIAFTMSYAALYASASWLADTQLRVINDGDLRFLFPLGIDAVIVYFLAMDLVMEWQGRRHPLNRWAAYGLSAITVVLNVSQGEGTTASYLGHAGPPVVIILIAEGVAAWVRHLAGLAHGTATDRIPAGRWIAHPLSTLKVARLMLGSGITSYPDALEREQQRQLAYAMLREQYGRTWRRSTPRHLKWMLDHGYDLATAFAIIRAMTAQRVAMTATEAHALLGARPAPTPTGHPVASEWPAMASATGQHGHAPTEDEQDQPALATTPEPDPPAVSSPQGQPGPPPLVEEQRPASEVPAQHHEVEEPTPQPSDTPSPRSSRPLSANEKRQRVRELLHSVPDITDKEIAGQLGVAPRTARRYRTEILTLPRDEDEEDYLLEDSADGQTRLVRTGQPTH
ncbi:DUF2637 domain-containing protein [Halostreptopolyspora alba]|uniref:DUF2637 domain-containing protein n=1 Tax=Halostreptopolyspora alba TaxID=2487137 RepID=A0A3N0DYN4_9ACTN|nr:DUF2637 domain-containing protein [Nocardiopsaceae bacterium YIM 96095]